MTSTSGRRRRVFVAVVAVFWAVLAVRPAAAHVRYVSDAARDGGIEFVVDVLSNPVNAALVGGTGVGAVAAVGGYLWVRPTVPDFEVLRSALAEYLTYVPWMLRLSLGLPLIGAGFAVEGGYFFSPAVPLSTVPFLVVVDRLFMIGLGFLLLFGLGTRVVAAVGLAAYLGGLLVDPNLLLSMEYVPGFLAIILLGSGRPSADHLLSRLAGAKGTLYSRIDPIHVRARRVRDRIDPYTMYVPVVLRVGLGVTFVYLGLIEKLANPAPGIALANDLGLPSLIPVSAEMWVLGAGLSEIAFGLALIAGLLTRATAAGAFLLFTITLFGLENDPVLAHITMFGLASAVFTLGSGPLSIDAWLDRETDEDRTGVPA
ncbi:DoxX family membrane protein [Halapricum sp. CBA1109]|uniref:DoxX family protein n=1 Tax=Halapricum sp. CBA1109 TaxID=2668068 RepID=UPI0012F9568F|nr:DoxX family protein [Halapricum sp. CBA1109]MUV90268.1 DoxX family membrane protein [Halapricum sp. CBA1109]